MNIFNKNVHFSKTGKIKLKRAHKEYDSGKAKFLASDQLIEKEQLESLTGGVFFVKIKLYDMKAVSVLYRTYWQITSSISKIRWFCERSGVSDNSQSSIEVVQNLFPFVLSYVKRILDFQKGWIEKLQTMQYPQIDKDTNEYLDWRFEKTNPLCEHCVTVKEHYMRHVIMLYKNLSTLYLFSRQARWIQTVTNDRLDVLEKLSKDQILLLRRRLLRLVKACENNDWQEVNKIYHEVSLANELQELTLS